MTVLLAVVGVGLALDWYVTDPWDWKLRRKAQAGPGATRRR